jgi:hypothetical protein
MLKPSTKVTSQALWLAFRPACPPATSIVPSSGTTFLQTLGLPRPQLPDGVAGPEELVGEPGVRSDKKAPCNSFRISTCISIDSKQLEVLQNQRLQKTGGEGRVIVNQPPAESSAAPPLAAPQCSEASPMATAIGSSLPALHLLLHSSNSFVSLLDATFTKNKGGGWQELQFMSSSATPIIPVTTTRRSRLATFVSRTTHYSLLTTHGSFPCA